MEELYTSNHSIESGTKQKWYLKLSENAIHIITVFLFYIMLFITLGLVSRSYNALDQKDLTPPASTAIQQGHK